MPEQVPSQPAEQAEECAVTGLVSSLRKKFAEGMGDAVDGVAKIVDNHQGEPESHQPGRAPEMPCDECGDENVQE